MKIYRWFWLIFKKEHAVSFGGKKGVLVSRRFGRKSETAQQFIDRNGVICGKCGSLMYPGNRLWLFQAPSPETASKPGVLVLKDEDGEWVVGCLARGCIPTTALMCGALGMNRQASFFETPLRQAVRTNEPVLILDVGSHGS